MSTKPSTPSPRRLAAAAGAVGLVACLALASPAIAQLTVFDPANHAENALQAARQLQSLANEAQMLTAQARQLAASPYSHLAQSSQTIAEISALAGAVNGLSADISKLQGQFEDLYPTSVKGLDPKTALAQPIDIIPIHEEDRRRRRVGAADQAAGDDELIQYGRRVDGEYGRRIVQYRRQSFARLAAPCVGCARVARRVRPGRTWRRAQNEAV